MANKQGIKDALAFDRSSARIYLGVLVVVWMLVVGSACSSGGTQDQTEGWTDGQKATLAYYDNVGLSDGPLRHKVEQNNLCASWFYGERWKEMIHLNVYYFDKLIEKGLLSARPSMDEVEFVLNKVC